MAFRNVGIFSPEAVGTAPTPEPTAAEEEASSPVGPIVGALVGVIVVAAFIVWRQKKRKQEMEARAVKPGGAAMPCRCAARP